MASGELSLEKMKINDRLTSVEIINTQIVIKLDSLIKTNEAALVMLTGNGHPEQGIAFRLVQIEAKESGKNKNSTALWTFLSSLGVIVLADFIHRMFFHK